MAQYTTAPLPVLHIRYSIIIDLVPVLFIQHSILLSHYQSSWYYTVHYSPSTNLTDYDTVHKCSTISSADTTQSTTVPVLVHWYDTVYHCHGPVLLLHSPLLSQNQSYWCDTAHLCSSTSTTDTTQSATVLVLVLLIWYSLPFPWIIPTDTIQPATTPIPVLPIPCSPLLPKYQSYWYPSIHYCPNTSPIDSSQYTTAPELLLLIRYSTLCPSTSLIDKSVHNCPSTRPTDTLQSSTAPVQVLLIRHFWYVTVHCWPRNQSYSYRTVHYCHNTSLIDTTQCTISPVPVLLIHYSTLLSQYQSLW